MLWSLLWPVVWLAVTLLLGGLSGWYPYPFLDPRLVGAGGVATAAVGIAVALIGLAFLAGWVELRLPPFPRPTPETQAPATQG